MSYFGSFGAPAINVSGYYRIGHKHRVRVVINIESNGKPFIRTLTLILILNLMLALTSTIIKLLY